MIDGQLGLVGHEELAILSPDVAERQVVQALRCTLNRVCIGIGLEKLIKKKVLADQPQMLLLELNFQNDFIKLLGHSGQCRFLWDI